MANVEHQLRAGLARPWPVSGYAEVSWRPESIGDHCGGFAARGVTGWVRQLHALVRPRTFEDLVILSEKPVDERLWLHDLDSSKP